MTARMLLVLAVFLPAALTFAQSDANGGVPTISEIRVSGQSRFAEDQVIAASGLKSGDAFFVKNLNRAAERLGKSGVFEEVSYSYAPRGIQMDVEFKVREVTKFRRCIFDNFVWASNDDLQTRLEREIPLYLGEAPETGDMLGDLSRVLEEFSKERGVSVRVERSMHQARIGDPDWRHLFTAQGLEIKMQAVSFNGALTVNRKDLDREVADLIGKDYSVARCRAYASADLIPFYRERGYLRASIDVSARVLNHAQGSNEFGVEVIYTVTEGNVYRWMTSEWLGNQRMASADLEALTGMKPDNVANGKKIDEGWVAVKRAYGKNGYIDASLTAEPVFDEGNRRVHYAVSTSEGAQYRMGSFQAAGLPQAVAERLKSKWRLKTGDVFDMSYLSEFTKTDAPSALAGTLTRSSKIKITTLPNKEQHVVDITFQLE
jgi:outer membrane protein insertion porin family